MKVSKLLIQLHRLYRRWSAIPSDRFAVAGHEAEDWEKKLQTAVRNGDRIIYLAGSVHDLESRTSIHALDIACLRAIKDAQQYFTAANLISV